MDDLLWPANVYSGVSLLTIDVVVGSNAPEFFYAG